MADSKTIHAHINCPYCHSPVYYDKGDVIKRIEELKQDVIIINRKLHSFRQGELKLNNAEYNNLIISKKSKEKMIHEHNLQLKKLSCDQELIILKEFFKLASEEFGEKNINDLYKIAKNNCK